MPENRVVYQNWIVELGLDPNQLGKLFDVVEVNSIPDDEIDLEVRRAVESLQEEEMEFVIRFYFMGQSYHEISEKSSRAIYKLEALHKRAIRKLKSRLRKFVRNKYGVKSPRGRPCQLCQSANRAAINEIIAKKSESSTWKPVIRELNKRFGLKIKAPSMLIGHWKYHVS